MITSEDHLRDLLDQVGAPDVAPPTFETLRRRAHRHRVAQATSVVGALAVVAAGTIGGLALARGAAQHHDAGPITATATQLDGHRDAWLIATQHLGKRQLRAATYVESGQTCIAATGGHTWCTGTKWPDTVADSDESSLDVHHPTVVVVGRVPIEARTVTVRIADHAVTVDAVRTPSSNDERFFAAFVPSRYGAVDSYIGVRDAQGLPVAPPTHVAGPTHNGDRGHIAGLPSNQTVISYLDSPRGSTSPNSPVAQAVVYTTESSACVAVAWNNVRQGSPRCTPLTTELPSASRPLINVQLPSGFTVIVGDAPAWTRSINIDSNHESTGIFAVNQVDGTGDRIFWAAIGSAKDTAARLTTCRAGANCLSSQRVELPPVQRQPATSG